MVRRTWRARHRSTHILYATSLAAGTTVGMTTTDAMTLRTARKDDDHWLDTRAYPFTRRRWACPEGTLSYIDEGQGEVLLFVHGTPSWSFEFRHVIAAMRESHRCVAIDHLGFGLSDKPVGGAYRPEDHARRLQAFVQALDLRGVTLVVHDFGGPDPMRSTKRSGRGAASYRRASRTSCGANATRHSPLSTSRAGPKHSRTPPSRACRTRATSSPRRTRRRWSMCCDEPFEAATNERRHERGELHAAMWVSGCGVGTMLCKAGIIRLG